MHPDVLDDLRVSPRPCAAGLIAATLALMTCWAAPDGTKRACEEQQRLLMARKIVSNLGLLRQHPDVAPGLRLIIAKVHARWMALAQVPPAAAALEAGPFEPCAVGNAVH